MVVVLIDDRDVKAGTAEGTTDPKTCKSSSCDDNLVLHRLLRVSFRHSTGQAHAIANGVVKIRTLYPLGSTD